MGGCALNNTVCFKFVNYQTVNIKAIETKGFVFSRMNNEHDTNEYKVTYWIDSKRVQEWFYEFELSTVDG